MKQSRESNKLISSSKKVGHGDVHCIGFFLLDVVNNIVGSVLSVIFKNKQVEGTLAFVLG